MPAAKATSRQAGASQGKMDERKGAERYLTQNSCDDNDDADDDNDDDGDDNADDGDDGGMSCLPMSVCLSACVPDPVCLDENGDDDDDDAENV